MPHRIIAVALCAALSACAGQTGGPGDATGEAVPVDDQSMSEPQQPSEVAARPPQQAAIDPASLVGMTGKRITALFGTPVFVRRDPPGEFWRYRGKSCVLEFFFYQQDGAHRVNHFETRNPSANPGANPLDRVKCIAKLRKPPAQG